MSEKQTLLRFNLMLNNKSSCESLIHFFFFVFQVIVIWSFSIARAGRISRYRLRPSRPRRRPSSTTIATVWGYPVTTIRVSHFICEFAKYVFRIIEFYSRLAIATERLGRRVIIISENSIENSPRNRDVRV